MSRHGKQNYEPGFDFDELWAFRCVSSEGVHVFCAAAAAAAVCCAAGVVRDTHIKCPARTQIYDACRVV